MTELKLIRITRLLIFFFIASNFLNAQTPLRIGAGFNMVFPTGDYTQLAKTGIGGSILVDYSILHKFSLGLSSSYGNLPSKIPEIGAEGKVLDFDINSIDLLINGRYYFNSSFFGLLETGVKYLMLHANIYDAVSNSKEKASSEYKPYFSGGGGIGYNYNLAEGKSDFELTGLYQFVSGDVINFPNFLLRASIMIYL